MKKMYENIADKIQELIKADIKSKGLVKTGAMYDSIIVTADGDGDYIISAVDYFVSNYSGRSVKLKSGVTYVVNNSMTLQNTTMLSSVSSSPAYLNVNPAATMNNTGNAVTDIDSSGGQTVISPLSTFLRTVNWSLTPMMGNFLLMF